MHGPAPATTAGIRFVDHLADHGDAVAVVDHDGTAVSYRHLDGLVAEAARRLGEVRRLVLVTGANRLDALVWYLGALRGGHVVLLTGAAHASRIADVHRPDVVVSVDERTLVDERCAGTSHDLHPDLALLLSTSGSTGSPKLVRLSHANIEANASAIAASLGLTAADRAITSLPMQYCYGLSVIHSHLGVGAGVVLSEASVVDPCFWAAARRHGVTNVAGVPHTFELLDRIDLQRMAPPTLRLLTQAGGRMDAAAVRRHAVDGRRAGWELFVMYGQTEATARMAYLPPALADTRPDAVGVAVAGGSFRIDPLDGCAPGEGEVVYRGDNVMMGYATSPADLARGAELDELRTGDIGRIAADGLLEIVGRCRHFVKPFGLRVDLGAIDRLLDERGVEGRCAGDDDGVAVAICDGTSAESVAALVREHTGLPAGAVAVATFDTLPRLETGKLDRGAILAGVRERGRPAPTSGAGSSSGSGDSAAALLASILGVDRVGPDDSFVSLGGDSLSYVEVSVALEDRLGRLPEGWHLLPVRDLDAARATPRRLAQVETSVVLRAVAICLIVGNHAGVFLVGGGAHVLFAAAGFNFARFQLAGRSSWRSILRLVAPAVAWIGAVAAVTDDFDLAHTLLLHGWIGGRGRWAYWFVEVLVQVLVVLALVLAVPAVRRFERRHRFTFPALLLTGSLLVRFDVVDTGRHHYPYFRPHEILWIFLLGWMAAHAGSVSRRLAVSAVVVAAVPGFFGNPTREAVLGVGLLALLWLPTVPVIRPLHRVAGVVGGASLYVYLTHVQVHHLISDRSPVAGLALSLIVGVAVWRVADPLVRRLGAHTPVPWRPAPSAKRAAPASVSPDRTGTSPRRASLASASSSGSAHCS